MFWVLRKPQTKALNSSDPAKGPACEHSEGDVPLTASRADCGPAARICAQAAQGHLTPHESPGWAFWGFCFLKVLPSLQPRECAFSSRQELCVPSLQTLRTVPCPFASGNTDCFLEFIYNFRMTSAITSNSFRPVVFQISIGHFPYNVHCAQSRLRIGWAVSWSGRSS